MELSPFVGKAEEQFQRLMQDRPTDWEHALDAAITKAEWRTADLGGPLGTKAFGQRVAALLKA
jgi:isocitrate/isopropylmalate dehydrogenase